MFVIFFDWKFSNVAKERVGKFQFGKLKAFGRRFESKKVLKKKITMNEGKKKGKNNKTRQKPNKKCRQVFLLPSCSFPLLLTSSNGAWRERKEKKINWWHHHRLSQRIKYRYMMLLLLLLLPYVRQTVVKTFSSLPTISCLHWISIWAEENYLSFFKFKQRYGRENCHKLNLISIRYGAFFVFCFLCLTWVQWK